MFDRTARADFSRARRKALFQKFHSWLSGKSNTLLPYDKVREAIPIQGQRYIGLRPIPIEQIIGSMGRYHEFTRAFLPTQDHLESRWVNIGRAHYEDITLPPIDVFKIGEVYFVRDGNHRVSVGRDRGAAFIDAFVTEIDVPVSLTVDTDLSDLETMRGTAEFLRKTSLLLEFPDANIEVSLKGEVERLIEHIDTHRYYLSLASDEEPTFEEAARSWYTRVYTPLVDEIEEQDINAAFPSLTKTDIYLLVSEYQWLLREAYKDEEGLAKAQDTFKQTLTQVTPQTLSSARRITRTMENIPWLDAYVLRQEKEAFENATGIRVKATVPGAYAKLLLHIRDHQWYLGIDKDEEINWEDAVISWRENIYLPIIVLIEEMQILPHFPERTEADLYLWIIKHRADLSESLNWEVPSDIAAIDFIDQRKQETDPDLQPIQSTNALLRRGIFSNILVPIGDEPGDLHALDQALIIAERNRGRIYGLHVINTQDDLEEDQHAILAEIFSERCSERGISGNIAFETGSISRRIAQRASWMDLIVLPLNYPPGGSLISRLSSGYRYILRRSGKPVLAVPQKATHLKKILLAYDGSQLADEALFIASCLQSFWEDTELTIITAGEKRSSSPERLTRARSFLDSHMIKGNYIRAGNKPAEAIIELAENNNFDLILMGGYGDSPLVEMTLGSTLNAVLQKSNIPVLIRT